MPGAGSAVEESEVVGVWGRSSAHTQEERLEPPYLLPPQLRMQCLYLAACALPLRFVLLPLGPALVLLSPVCIARSFCPAEPVPSLPSIRSSDDGYG